MLKTFETYQRGDSLTVNWDALAEGLSSFMDMEDTVTVMVPEPAKEDLRALKRLLIVSRQAGVPHVACKKALEFWDHRDPEGLLSMFLGMELERCREWTDAVFGSIVLSCACGKMIHRVRNTMNEEWFAIQWDRFGLYALKYLNYHYTSKEAFIRMERAGMDVLTTRTEGFLTMGLLREHVMRFGNIDCMSFDRAVELGILNPENRDILQKAAVGSSGFSTYLIVKHVESLDAETMRLMFHDFGVFKSNLKSLTDEQICEMIDYDYRYFLAMDLYGLPECKKYLYRFHALAALNRDGIIR